ncbi:hypothetical protein SUDANB106_04110 [Streptomyces sp. enrichment culture]|uniref:hypothetical protein n=1 Tax=Streptomyces sp. enrichment culture TaxID=1795815 RepID=UPI003F54418B
MALDPVTATLLGTAIGAAATILSTSVTQRATRDREREVKVWERRADAIEEAHRKMLALGNTRDLAWQRKQVPADPSPQNLDAGHQDEQFRLVVTKLTLYTTPELVQMYRESNQAFLKSVMAIQMLQLALVNTSGSRRARDRDINLRTPEAARAVRESQAADERLEVALREASALGAPSTRRRWWQR